MMTVGLWQSEELSRVHTECSNRVEYLGLLIFFGTSGNACLCSSKNVLVFQSLYLVEYVLLHSKYHSYARMLVIKSPSGCPWFTLTCCVMAGPCLYQVAIRMSALSSNPLSAHVYRAAHTKYTDLGLPVTVPGPLPTQSRSPAPRLTMSLY